VIGLVGLCCKSQPLVIIIIIKNLTKFKQILNSDSVCKKFPQCIMVREM